MDLRGAMGKNATVPLKLNFLCIAIFCEHFHPWTYVRACAIPPDMGVERITIGVEEGWRIASPYRGTTFFYIIFLRNNCTLTKN